MEKSAAGFRHSLPRWASLSAATVLLLIVALVAASYIWALSATAGLFRHTLADVQGAVELVVRAHQLSLRRYSLNGNDTRFRPSSRGEQQE